MGHGSEFQEKVREFVRAFGLHHPDQTPCGVEIAVSDAHAITEIAERPEITQRELAARLYLEKSTVSRLVCKLEDRGWVVRQRSHLDRRATTLVLTEQGERVAEEITTARAQKFADVLGRIPANEQDQVMNSLDRLIAAVSEASEKLHASIDDSGDYAGPDVAGRELRGRRHQRR